MRGIDDLTETDEIRNNLTGGNILAISIATIPPKESPIRIKSSSTSIDSANLEE
jgi:hypothetical protein